MIRADAGAASFLRRRSEHERASFRTSRRYLAKRSEEDDDAASRALAARLAVPAERAAAAAAEPDEETRKLIAQLAAPPPAPAPATGDPKVDRLVGMGFGPNQARRALEKHKGNLELAVNALLTGGG